MSELNNEQLPDVTKTPHSTNQEVNVTHNSDATQHILNEINRENAEDAEDLDNKKRHEIPMLHYEAMSLDALKQEFKKLLHTEKVQAIKKHVDAIKNEFDKKYEELLEEKKEEYIADGGEEYDFKYEHPLHREFYALVSEYRDKRNQYYKDLGRN